MLGETRAAGVSVGELGWILLRWRRDVLSDMEYVWCRALGAGPVLTPGCVLMCWAELCCTYAVV